MAITGIEYCDLALEDMVIGKATTFWHAYVLKDVPPPASSITDCQTLFGKGNPNQTVEAIEETVKLTRRLQLLNTEIAVREEEISAIKQTIMSQMGEAELLTHQGKTLATWKAPRPSFRLDSKRLEADYPEIAELYKTPVQNSRRLVIKPFSN